MDDRNRIPIVVDPRMPRGIAALVSKRAEEHRIQLLRIVDEPVPEPNPAMLDSMSWFRYGVPYADLPDGDEPEG